MLVENVIDVIHQVVQKNRRLVLKKGANAIYQINAMIDGVTYNLGVNNGRITQLYPV